MNSPDSEPSIHGRGIPAHVVKLAVRRDVGPRPTGIPMSQNFYKRLEALTAAAPGLLAGGRKGIEKEALRVADDGTLAQTPHPARLGSALTNRYITTDFSEALLEFITPAFGSTWEALQFLCDIHQFTYDRLDRELLWPASMPCALPDDAQIPLARYGSSNIGTMKTVYRRGLGYRYGRHMQTIAGVHFNYSLPEPFWPVYRELQGSTETLDRFRSRHYLGLIRNFRRLGWLVLYLFGASPAMCRSFAGDRELHLPSLEDGTWYEPYGTSLRMSDLGYSNRSQARIRISLNDLDEYIRDLSDAIATKEPAFESIGIKVGEKYRQLNANRLQIENEYYSPIRPKRVARSGERPTMALRRGGIEYVEIRSLDISVDDPAGINQNTMRFIEAFLVYCLLEDSPPFTETDLDEAQSNQTATAKRGRDPAFRLRRGGAESDLKSWAFELIERVQAVAEAIDRRDNDGSYSLSVGLMRDLVVNPDATPSARLLSELTREGCSFFELGLALAEKHRDYFRSIARLSDAREAEFEKEAHSSLLRQREIEAADRIGFDEYLARYFAGN